jgi:AmmeMemoRadiSam system protein B
MERQTMIRPPAVAGQFYPGAAAQVNASLDHLMRPVEKQRDALAVVVPHAGWMYSGATAGMAYAAVRVPDRVIMLGPNHHGLGSPYAVADTGAWRTPVGDAPICEPLAAALIRNCALLTADRGAHSMEHSLEVQVPFLLRRNPNVQIVPILIGRAGRKEMREIGAAIARTVQESGERVLLLASSDMNHYEDQETSNRKDKLALDAVVKLDEETLLKQVATNGISMCGVLPTYIVLVAAKALGAKHAELLDYRTSGDTTGDYSAVVGYGAVVIE